MAGIGLLDSILAQRLFAPNVGLLSTMTPTLPVGSSIEPQFGGGNAASIPVPTSNDAGGPDDAAAAREAAAARVRRGVIKPWSPNPIAPPPGLGVSDSAPALDPTSAPPVPVDVDPNAGTPISPSQNAADYEHLADAFGTDEPGAPLSISPQQDDKLPPNAAPTAGQLPGAAPVAPSLLSQIAGKLFDPNKAATWLALGAGFSGAPSFGTGMRRAAANAVPALAADRAQIQRQQTITDTFNALRAKGIPASEALAASQNPEIMKAVAGKYFEAKPRVPHKIGTDMLGNDIMGSFDPNSGKFYDAAGQEIRADGQGAAAGSPMIQGGQSLLAKGVTQYDPTLPADEYLAQFSPEIQAAMKNYARGDSMPVANPRLKGMTQKIKEWTQLWGDKAGIPVSDATFSERRKYRTELGSTGSTTAGGQAKAFNQGIEHMRGLAGAIEKYRPSNALGIPAVARGVNWLSEAFSTKQSDIARQVNTIGQTLAGEVGKLFSGSAGGGVHERELTRKRFESVQSAPELAGALEATLETMEGGLHALEQRRDQILGPNNDVVFLEKDTQKRIDEIRGIIAQLRGEAAPAPAAAPQLAPGQSVTINGVTIRKVK